ncbi:quinone oxidoreductase, partial [Chytriomyces sp. MP71]
DVLIHAGASGVGIAAIQLAKLKKANRIIVTVGSDAKKEFCKSIGATQAINYKSEDFAAEISKITQAKGVHVLVDFVGATHWDGNLASLALDGRMVMLAFLSGAVVKESNLSHILRKRLMIRGSTLRSRDLVYQRRLKEAVEKEVFVEIFKGEAASHIKTVVDKSYSWKDIVEAHNYLESNASMGKIVVNVD